MVCFICCAALCGVASAADVSPRGLVTGVGTFYTSDDFLYSLGGEPNISLGGISTSGGFAPYNEYQFTYGGKAIPNVPAGRQLVNVNIGTIKQVASVNDVGLSELHGRAVLHFYLADGIASSSDAHWLSGASATPSSYTYSVMTWTETITGSGTGSQVDFDLTGLDGVQTVTIEWYFGIKSIYTPSTYSGGTLYPSFRTMTTVMGLTGNADANNQQEIIDGINESNGLLAGIQNTISNVWTAITSLPSQIAEAIKGLFVPTDAQINELKTGFNNLLETKLGFVYQAVSLVDGVVVAVFDACDNPDSDVAFTIPAFPAFEVAGERVSLWDEPITVDLSENEVVSTIQAAASPFIVAVLVLAFAHSMENAFYAFVGGQTLIEWIRGRHEE